MLTQGGGWGVPHQEKLDDVLLEHFLFLKCADAPLLLFSSPSLWIFTFQLKQTNNTNEVIFIQASDISLAVILFYGVETHAEINRLPHRKR